MQEQKNEDNKKESKLLKTEARTPVRMGLKHLEQEQVLVLVGKKRFVLHQ